MASGATIKKVKNYTQMATTKAGAKSGGDNYIDESEIYKPAFETGDLKAEIYGDVSRVYKEGENDEKIWMTWTTTDSLDLEGTDATTESNPKPDAQSSNISKPNQNSTFENPRDLPMTDEYANQMAIQDATSDEQIKPILNDSKVVTKQTENGFEVSRIENGAIVTAILDKNGNVIRVTNSNSPDSFINVQLPGQNQLSNEMNEAVQKVQAQIKPVDGNAASGDLQAASTNNNSAANIKYIQTIMTDDFKCAAYDITKKKIVVAANKDGKYSRIYLYNKDGKSEGSITVDVENIKGVSFDSKKDIITVTLENGKTREYNYSDMKEAMEIAQAYPNRPVVLGQKPKGILTLDDITACKSDEELYKLLIPWFKYYCGIYGIKYTATLMLQARRETLGLGPDGIYPTSNCSGTDNNLGGLKYKPGSSVIGVPGTMSPEGNNYAHFENVSDYIKAHVWNMGGVGHSYAPFIEEANQSDSAEGMIPAIIHWVSNGTESYSALIPQSYNELGFSKYDIKDTKIEGYNGKMADLNLKKLSKDETPDSSDLQATNKKTTLSDSKVVTKKTENGYEVSRIENRAIVTAILDKNGNVIRVTNSNSPDSFINVQLPGQNQLSNEMNEAVQKVQTQIKDVNKQTNDSTDIAAAKPANNTNKVTSNSENIVQNVISGVSQAVAGITKMAGTNAKYKKLINKGYNIVSEVSTKKGNFVVCNKDGKNSKIYLYDKNGDKTGSIVLAQKDIKNVEYNKDKKTIIVTDSKGKKKKYSQDRIKSSIEFANNHKDTPKGKYYANDGEKVVELAKSAMGADYVWGGCSPDGYDCSGLVAYALTGKHERLGATQGWCADHDTWTPIDNPQPGDVCLSDHHTGIYIGKDDNGVDQMVHAPDFGQVVQIGPVQGDMHYVRYNGPRGEDFNS